MTLQEIKILKTYFLIHFSIQLCLLTACLSACRQMFQVLSLKCSFMVRRGEIAWSDFGAGLEITESQNDLDWKAH